MSLVTFADTRVPDPVMTASGEYVPGVCNIGPAEIAKRRRTGHTGLVVAILLLVVLVAGELPPITRLLIAIPVAVSASGYLQAFLKFCAGFGSLGVFNFDELGATEAVMDAEAKRRDKVRSFQIGLASFAIGIAVAIVAVLLPV